MSYLSIGDMALTFQNRRQNIQMKSDLARLALELASGRKSDTSTAIAGDYAPIVGLERDLKANLAYGISISEAGMFASVKQSSLEMIQGVSSELGPALMNAGNTQSASIIQIAATDAKQKFSAIISALNTQVAGRYVFSGTATDTPALANAETILAALQVAVSAETTAAGVQSTVNAWFDDLGGGYETLAFTGSTTAMAPFKLSGSEAASLEITAFDPEIRSLLKGFAMASLIDQGALSTDVTERANLALAAGEQILGAEYTLAVLRAKIGSGEALIDGASARNSAEKIALGIARTELTAVDPYRVATELEAVKFQLETMYTLTVRLSRLTLAEFLR